MQMSKSTDAQNAFVIKQGGETTPGAGICRNARISPETCFKRLFGAADHLSHPFQHPHFDEAMEENRCAHSRGGRADARQPACWR